MFTLARHITLATLAVGATPARQEVTILDGGMGRLLKKNNAPFGAPWWSAIALWDEENDGPQHVVRAHKEFIEAGAEVITTNAYALVPFHCGEKTHHNGEHLAATAGRLARQATQGADHPVRVAGSLPPLFGSYAPEKWNPGEAAKLAKPLIEGQQPYVDLWLQETLSTSEEAFVYNIILDTLGDEKPRWASFTLNDEKNADGKVVTRGGEPVEDVFAVVTKFAKIEAVVFNCSAPEIMLDAIKQVEAAKKRTGRADIKTGAYANLFVNKTIELNKVGAGKTEVRTDVTIKSYADEAEKWIDAGATIVGGCCSIMPEHIAELSQRELSKRAKTAQPAKKNAKKTALRK